MGRLRVAEDVEFRCGGHVAVQHRLETVAAVVRHIAVQWKIDQQAVLRHDVEEVELLHLTGIQRTVEDADVVQLAVERVSVVATVHSSEKQISTVGRIKGVRAIPVIQQLSI